MSSTVEQLPGHPVEYALARIDGLLAEVAGLALWSLSAAELERLTLRSYETLSRLQGLVVDLVGEADARGVADSVGASSTTSWLVCAARVRPAQAKATVSTARAFRAGMSVTADALRGGQISGDAAAVITRAVADLPGGQTDPAAADAEQVLVEQAAALEPVALARLGRTIVEVVDPEGADERLGRELERQDRRADRAQRLSLTPDGVLGGAFVSGHLDALTTAAVRAVLDPLAAPRPDDASGPDLRPPDRRQADALGEAMRRLLGDGGLPATGGVKPQVVVTMSLETLRDGDGCARVLPDGDPVPASAARTAACQADIVPVVLGTAGEPLDVGRRVRFFGRALRTALEVRDRGCAFPGCRRRPRWCDAHHILSWWAGGVTSLANGVLLCGWHHRLIHRGEWTVQLAPDGLPEFLPPAWIDQQRRPRRNPRPEPAS
jgi:Domain of unknown function (DUF222)